MRNLMHLRNLIIYLNQVGILSKAFKILFKIQLHIICKVYSVHPSTRAVVLRRPHVLFDLYLGDSDLDLTLVIQKRNGLYKIMRFDNVLYRILKKIFPVLGEVLIIDEDVFEVHLKHMFFAYGKTNPVYFIYRHPSYAPPHVGECFLENITWKVSELFKTLLYKEFYRCSSVSNDRSPTFSRALLKLNAKLDWLLQMQRTAQPESNLNYNDHFLPNQVFCSQQERSKLFEGTLNWLGKFEKKSSSSSKHIIASYRKDIGFNWTRLLRIAEYVKNSYLEFSEIIDEVKICYFFMFQTGKSIVVKVNTKLNNPLVDKLKTSFLKRGEIPFYDEEHWVSPYPIIMDQDIHDLFRQNMPIFEMSEDSSSFDLIEMRFNHIEKASHQLNTLRIKLLLQESMVNILSLPRIHCPAYLLDLIFGHFMLYRTMLSEETIDISLRELIIGCKKNQRFNKKQMLILNQFIEGDLISINKRSSFDIWRVFEDIIMEEYSLAEEIIASS